MALKNEFLDVLKKSFNFYNKYVARSNEKLKPIHSWISQEIKKKLGENYEIKSLGFERRKVKKIEIINNKDILKYINLFKDKDFPHKPQVLGIVILMQMKIKNKFYRFKKNKT